MGRPKHNFHDLYVPVTESGCWLWMGRTNKDGYGLIWGNRYAHRVSVEIHNGPIPHGMLVCHKCDTRSCVNPMHLYIGTPADNSRDAMHRSRIAYGERASKSKLKNSDVIEILASSLPAFVLAEKYGVTDTSICLIKLGKTWRHIPRQPGYNYRVRRNRSPDGKFA